MTEKNQQVMSFVESERGLSVESFVEKKKWEQDADFVKRVVMNDLTADDEEWMESKLENCDHCADSRSKVEYGAELIRSWLIEDLLAEKLAMQGFPTNLCGKDNTREFLANPNGDADLSIETPNGTFFVEIITDYGGFWQSQNVVDFRDTKLDTLQNYDNILIIGYDMKNNDIVVFNPRNVDAEYMNSHPAWSKPAYRVTVDNNWFYSLSNISKAVNDQIK
jgi:hypothetical protein